MTERDPSDTAAGWLEATAAWAVCASIHRQYCKGKDPFYTTRQADFTKHEAAARAKLNALLQHASDT
jgi:hypothetical protein